MKGKFENKINDKIQELQAVSNVYDRILQDIHWFSHTVINPETGEAMEDEDGNSIYEPDEYSLKEVAILEDFLSQLEKKVK